MNMTTVPSDQLKAMQQEITDLKEQVAQLRIEADFNFEQYQDAGRLMFDLQKIAEQQAEAIQLKNTTLKHIINMNLSIITSKLCTTTLTIQP